MADAAPARGGFRGGFGSRGGRGGRGRGRGRGRGGRGRGGKEDSKEWVPVTNWAVCLEDHAVQKQTRAGQRTRFKAFVAIGDNNGHIGLGVKCSKEVATLSVVPSSWLNCLSSLYVVATGVTRSKLLTMAGIQDCYTSARGSTGTLGNFAKATYAAIAKTYAYLTPDLWKRMPLGATPYQQFADFLADKPGSRH
ncbi:40S ribosomal protein S2 [Lucilia cuprina]|nr:40S ribosomal protein S2 [Lucilia cuprina]